jgi:linoleoyl-CoA desaturase
MRITFNKSTQFYSTLRKEVEAYFQSKKLAKHGNAALYSKTVILLGSFAALYTILVFFTPVWYIALPLAMLFGMNCAFIGFNIMHDACHESYSKNPKVNYYLGHTMNLLGSSAFIWKTKHNTVHHTFTNVDGVDDDIVKVPIFRWAKTQPLKKLHRFQHIYAFFIYMLSPIFWVFLTDYPKYFTKSVGHVPLPKISTKEHIIFWGSKLFYIAFYIAIPLYFLPTSTFLIGYFAMNAVFGLTLSLVFQLAHVVENTHFTSLDEKTEELSVEDEWAVFQMATTSNFATNNKVISWCLGGLNFQVEHHLFSRISHVHYPALNKILIKVCKETGVQYNAYPTMWQAFKSHMRYVKRLGNVA